MGFYYKELHLQNDQFVLWVFIIKAMICEMLRFNNLSIKNKLDVMVCSVDELLDDS